MRLRNILLLFFILMIVIGCGGSSSGSSSGSGSNVPLTDSESTTQDRDALVINGSESLNNVTQNLTLPTTGANGTIITWTSSNPSVISNTGRVTRPSYDTGDVQVILTALITKGISRSAVDVKVFNITVLKVQIDDAEVVEENKAFLAISYGGGDNVSSVTQNVGLATSGSSGTLISWASDNAGVISINGVVTRPLFGNGNQVVGLTATISKGVDSDTKEFTLIAIETPQTDLEAILDDLTSLVVTYGFGDNIHSVTQNVGLPATGSSGTSISWASDNSGVITDDGTVIRPVWQSDVNIVLTATITKNGQSREKEFYLKVETVYSVIKTGQTATYMGFDDGFYQKGATKYFSRNDATGIVTDNVNGLLWQDNNAAKNIFEQWSEALGDCGSLGLDGHSDWRLPNINELKLIVDYSKENSSIDSVFQNVVSDYYWSSTIYASDTDNACYVSFSNGFNSNNNAKTYSHYVRCVRGGQLLFDDFIIDNMAEVVIDRATGLIWQDDNVADTKNWSDAIDYCETLNLDGHIDWRLPNINELESIVDYSKFNPAINSVFQNIVSAYYWSSTTSTSMIGEAWLFAFNGGFNGYIDKTNSYYVRCVRGGQ